jgi:hypothetical protein
MSTNSVNIFTGLFFIMVKSCTKSDGGVQFCFKKEHLREIGEIINDGQNIFGPTE